MQQWLTTFADFLTLAAEQNAGFILDSQTWKAHPHWAQDLGATPDELREANIESVRFIAGLRAEFPDNPPIVLCGVIGPRGDAYAPGSPGGRPRRRRTTTPSR